MRVGRPSRLKMKSPPSPRPRRASFALPFGTQELIEWFLGMAAPSEARRAKDGGEGGIDSLRSGLRALKGLRLCLILWHPLRVCTGLPVRPLPSANGGEGGIRTPGTLAGSPDFESGAIDHSATSPSRRAKSRALWAKRKRKVFPVRSSCPSRPDGRPRIILIP